MEKGKVVDVNGGYAAADTQHIGGVSGVSGVCHDTPDIGAPGGVSGVSPPTGVNTCRDTLPLHEDPAPGVSQDVDDIDTGTGRQETDETLGERLRRIRDERRRKKKL